MYKEIYLPTSKKKELQNTFKTTKVSLWNALTFKTNSPFAKMLRAAARERGGVLYDESQNISPKDFETYFITSENLMVQNFNEGVKLTVSLSDGLTIIYLNGEEVKRFDNPHITEINQIQAIAQTIANGKQSVKSFSY